MPSISNAGGSLTSALVLTLLAWAVETGACPHLIIDVRRHPSPPLIPELKGAVSIPASDIREVLSKGRRWAEVCGTLRRPSPETLLIFLGSDSAGQEEGAAGAAAAGFQRTLGLHPPLDAGAGAGPAPAPELAVIRPDALATLLGWGGIARELQLGPLAPVTLIDVRRWDERLLYGSIRGSVGLAADEIPSALRLTPQAFEERYHFPLPGHHDLVVVASRSLARAAWAATLAADAGFGRWLVLQGGHNGWRFDSNVRPYRAYAAGDPPPEPEPSSVIVPNREEGLAELTALGLW